MNKKIEGYILKDPKTGNILTSIMADGVYYALKPLSEVVTEELLTFEDQESVSSFKKFESVLFDESSEKQFKSSDLVEVKMSIEISLES